MPSEEMPECCGSGCAVCVLDSVEPPVARVGPETSANADISDLPATPCRTDQLAAQCCGTGCTVCVLDYIEDDLPSAAPSAGVDNLSRMLEAIDRAEEILSTHRPKSPG
ncbi:MAG: hypothetical protein ACK562_17005 [Acidobacteriota bacterium]|jgi:hypothetical protein